MIWHVDGEREGTVKKTKDSPGSGRKGGAAWSNRTLTTVIIVSMVVFGIIAMIVLSHAAAPRTPHLEAVISYDSTTHTVTFSHTGGDPLPGPVRSLAVTDAYGALIPNTSPLVVYDTDGSADGTGIWSMGKSIQYPINPSSGVPSGARVMYTGPTQSVLASTRFTPVLLAVPPLSSPSPANAGPVMASVMLPSSQVPAASRSSRASTLAISQSGTGNPVTIQYLTDTSGSGSKVAPFTLSRADAVNSSFGGTLFAPLQDCTGDDCTGTPRYFSHWAVSGAISPEPVVQFAVADNATWTATAVYSDSLPCHSIGGRVWEDYTMDGVRDPGEPLLAGWTVSLYRQEGNTEVLVSSTTTDANGTYLFLDIPYTGQYTIRESLKPGWVQSYPLKGLYRNETLNFASRCRAIDRNFGNRKVLAADFTGEPASGPAPLTVRFNDQSTGTTQTWSWNFGDGYTSSRQNPVYTYLTAGIYGVSLSVANSYGQDHMLQKARYITVTPPVATVDLVLDTATGGYIAAGGVVQFRVTGSNSYVQVGSTRSPLNATDVVRMAVGSDSTGKVYLTSGSSLTSFSLSDVDLYINGDLQKTGEVSAIYISALDQFSSSLRLIIPAKGAKMSLAAGGDVIVSGTTDKPLTIRDIRPDSSFHSIALDADTYRVTFNGGATGYSLQ